MIDNLIKQLNMKKCEASSIDNFTIKFLNKNNTTITTLKELQITLINKFDVDITDVGNYATQLIEHIIDNQPTESGDKTMIGEKDILNLFSQYIKLNKHGKWIMIQELPYQGDFVNDTFAERQNNSEIYYLDEDQAYTQFVKFLTYLQSAYTFEVKSDYETIFHSYLERVKEKRFQKWKTKLTHEPQDIDYLQEIIEATIEDKSLWEGYYTLFKHWLWLVKRNLYDKPTIYEIMLVFTGQHGTGKSFLTKQLTNIFTGETLKASFHNVMETRSMALDSRKLIWNFEEMSFAEKSDINRIKDFITTDEAGYRPMGVNLSKQVTKKCTCIGSQNRPLGDTVMDNTGNRRFVDFPIKQKAKVYIDIFNKEHPHYDAFQPKGEAWVSIWKNVDENLDTGYYDNENDQIQTIFNNLVYRTTEYDFISNVFNLQGNGSYTTMPINLFYSVYSTWCKNNNVSPKGIKQFNISVNTIFDSTDILFPEVKIKGFYYIKIPPINNEYKNLFATLNKAIPNIIDKDGKHFFENNDLYSDPKSLTDVKIRTKNDEWVADWREKTTKNNGIVPDQEEILEEEIIDSPIKPSKEDKPKKRSAIDWSDDYVPSKKPTKKAEPEPEEVSMTEEEQAEYEADMEQWLKDEEEFMSQFD